MATTQGRPSTRTRARRVRHGVVAVAIGLFALDLVLAMVARAQPSPAAAAAAATPATAIAAPAAPAPGLAVAPPASLEDVAGWIDYKNRNHLDALPEEARLFFRRGMMLHESGAREGAMRYVRGAAELDPSYVAPHWTLASWNLTRDPSQALLQYAAVIDLARADFGLQFALVASLLYGGLQAVMLGLVAVGFMIVILHQSQLRHAFSERLAIWLSPVTAGFWSWTLLVLPYFAGVGLAAPTCGYLALLWPQLRARQRALFVALAGGLVAMPFLTSGFERLATPLRADRAPLHAVPLLEHERWTPARRAEVEQLAIEHPDNAWVRFAAGWMARRGGDLASAETHFRAAARLDPVDGRALSNLGNVVAMQGRNDEAIELFQEALERDPANAAIQFNASQLYTQRFDYQAASAALARASALDFELVKAYQARGTEDGTLPLVDQWIDPDRVWAVVVSAPTAEPGAGSLPPSWRDRIETSGVAFSAVVAALVAIGLFLGLRFQRTMPLRTCSNCGRTVCRRCARRRRELALCPACATVEAQAESPDFARMLLLEQKRRHQHAAHLVRTAAATLLPGFGLVAFRRVGTPFVLLAVTAVLLADAFAPAATLAFEPRLATDPAGMPLAVRAGLWILVYAFSIAGYFAHVSRAAAEAAAAAAPVKSRAHQVTRRIDAQAA